MGIVTELGMGRNGNWLHGNGREWECKQPFPHISNAYHCDVFPVRLVSCFIMCFMFIFIRFLNIYPCLLQWSGSPPKLNHLFIGPLPIFRENFMQIRSDVYAKSCQQSRTNKQRRLHTYIHDKSYIIKLLHILLGGGNKKTRNVGQCPTWWSPCRT